MKYSVRRYSLLVLFCVSVSSLYAYAPTNFNRPYDRTWIMPYWVDKHDGRVSPVKIGMQFENGASAHSYNEHADSVGVNARYQATQSGIAMLLGSAPGSDAYQVLLNLLGATDDGIRGNFDVSGKYHEFDYTFFATYDTTIRGLPGWLDFSVFVPIRSMKISDITFSDLTKSNTPQDIDVKRYLTSDIVGLAHQLGDLDITDWSMNGIGDLTLVGRWLCDFPQLERNITNVRAYGRLGLSIPTGIEQSLDRAFSLPLGNDGAWGGLIGAGLDLNFKWTIKGGLDVQFFKIFDKTKTYRLKTDSHQTDFLLLNKGRARKHYGSSWTFNLYAGSEHFFRGLSAYLNYQYFMHNDDHFFAQTNAFNNAIINTAESLQEYSYHNFLFQASYDFFTDISSRFFEPQLTFFYKLPLAGRRVVRAQSFGIEFALNF